MPAVCPSRGSIARRSWPIAIKPCRGCDYPNFPRNFLTLSAGSFSASQKQANRPRLGGVRGGLAKVCVESEFFEPRDYPPRPAGTPTRWGRCIRSPPRRGRGGSARALVEVSFLNREITHPALRAPRPGGDGAHWRAGRVFGEPTKPTGPG
jgi:hypothetical protein